MQRILVCVVLFYLVSALIGQPPAVAETSPDKTIQRWQDRIEKIHRQLEAGSWAAAERASEELAGEMAHGVVPLGRSRRRWKTSG